MPNNIYDSQIKQALKDKKDKLCAESWEAIRMAYRDGNLNEIVSDNIALLQLRKLDEFEQAPVIDVDDIGRQFNKILARIDETNQIIIDGWNDKQRDYANDSR